MTDFASITPEQVADAEQKQDDRLARIHATRQMLEYWLAEENKFRAEDGMDPVTLRIPEETK